MRGWPSVPPRTATSPNRRDPLDPQFAFGAPPVNTLRHLWPEPLIEPESDAVQFLRRERRGKRHHSRPDLRQAVAERSAASWRRNGPQARAVRAMLKWTVSDVAKMAGVAPNTVLRIEADDAVRPASMKVLQQV